MCGIAGRVSNCSAPSFGVVAAMTSAMRHRGPDDHQVVARGAAVLGHRRLAVVDLAGGRQPMANEDESVWLVYNGEVFNHREIANDLAARGHHFRTRSDTEALLHAYEEWGTRAVDRLRGMFAFAIWDERRRRLVLARDRFGIKPLFYSVSEDGDLAFASELRALLLDPTVDRAIDEDGLACYLELRYVPAPLTPLRGVRKLPPGSLLVWEAGRSSIERYWDLLSVPVRDETVSAVEAAAELRERIDHAVELRLMSDVPLGAFLSGGIDSTAVTASILARQPDRHLKTFAVGYDDVPAESELAWAAHAAHCLGTDHHEVQVSGQTAALALPTILWSLDEPIADPAAVPLWFLARRAREEVTVVLSGEGADEILGGYAIYAWMMRMERLRRLGLGTLGASLGRIAPWPRLRRGAMLLGLPLETRYRSVSRAFSTLSESTGRLLSPLWDATRGLSPLRRLLYLDLRGWLGDDILAKADRMTMAHSLELRVPLLDHLLAEWVWQLPDSLKVRGGVGKWLLRRAERGRVPETILGRPKRGFNTPAAAWLRGPMSSQLYGALLDRASFTRERFSQRFVEHLLDDHAQGRDRSPELWALLTLELWLGGMHATRPHRQSHPGPEGATASLETGASS